MTIISPAKEKKSRYNVVLRMSANAEVYVYMIPLPLAPSSSNSFNKPRWQQYCKGTVEDTIGSSRTTLPTYYEAAAAVLGVEQEVGADASTA